jgi:uncharacterized protein YbjT (DUF2867 family)
MRGAERVANEPAISIFVMGATGGTGRLVVREALERGHDVTAFVRDPTRLPIRHPNLDVRIGDALDESSILQALRPEQRIVCCLGIGPNGPRDFHASTSRTILAAAAQRDVSRIVVLSSLGTGSSAHRRTPVLALMFGVMRATWILEDKAHQEQLFLASGRNVTLLQPGLLNNGRGRGDVIMKVPTDLPPLGLLGPIVPRADVASTLVDMAEQLDVLPEVICLVREARTRTAR